MSDRSFKDAKNEHLTRQEYVKRMTRALTESASALSDMSERLKPTSDPNVLDLLVVSAALQVTVETMLRSMVLGIDNGIFMGRHKFPGLHEWFEEADAEKAARRKGDTGDGK